MNRLPFPVFRPLGSLRSALSHRFVRFLPTCSFVPLVSAAALLTGCSGGATPGGQSSTSGSSALLSGVVHGGTTPIAGAEVYLYAAGTGGYGTPARTVLSAPVTTNASGSFSITADTCQGGDQVYLLATGGTSGAATSDNNSIALAAALGSCSALTPSTSINVNEVTTVAAAYALAGFMNSPTSLSSSGTPLALIGVQNAFLNAANLASVGSGSANANTSGGNGTVPVAEIDTLANVLAACVSASGTEAPCSALFNAATPPGGTAPTDTFTAALNIAHNPGQNVGTLFALNATTAPFQPSLASAPHDWSLAVTYTGGGIGYGSSQGGSIIPGHHVAIDGLGNVWVSNPQDISLLGPAGNALSPATGFTAGLLTGSSAYSLVIDGANNAWIGASTSAGFISSVVLKMNSAGVLLSPAGGYTGGGLSNVANMTFDSAGNLWVGGGEITNPVSEFNPSGIALSPASGYAGPAIPGGGYLFYPSITADASGHVWWVEAEYGQGGTLLSSNGQCGGNSYFVENAVDAGGNMWTSYAYQPATIFKCDPTGALLSPGTGFAISTVVTDSPGVAVDGSNRIWFFDQSYGGRLGVMDDSGNLLAPAGGYQMEQDTGNAAEYMALDQSGDAWISSKGTTLVEFVGIATPVVAPLATALATKGLGARP